MPDIDFPVDVPKPGSLYGGEIDAWYRSAVACIPQFVDLDDPEIDDLEAAWAAKSRLRLAGAMGLIDQETVAAEFLHNNPLPGLGKLISLAERTSPERPLQEVARLLLNVPSKAPLDLRVVNNVSFAEVVMPDANGQMCVETPDGWKTLHPVLPPRPIVPNPEYLPTIEPFYATATVWQEIPSVGDYESDTDAPCALVTDGVMWLSYRTEDGQVAVVEFASYIEHQQSRIGSLLESHPYFNAGLKPRAFNMLSESLHTRYWSRFPACHWIINFPDRTLDIVACSAQLTGEPAAGTSTLEAVLEAAKRVLLAGKS